MKIVQYFVIGLIVICFTGCSGEGGNEPLLPPFGDVSDVPIAWGVDAKTTSNRALVTNENINTTGNAFSVFGSYDIVSNFTNPYKVFNNRKVYHNGSDWTYQPMETWVEGTYYRFRGFYPYTDNTNASAYWVRNDFQENADSCYLYLSVDDPAKQVDLMASDVVRRGLINYKEETTLERVVLPFKHLLTNVHLKLKKHPNDALNTIEIQSVRLKGMHTRALFAAAAEVDNGKWTYATINEEGFNQSYSNANPLILQTNETHVIWGEEGLLLIPQEVTNDVKLEIAMRVTKEMSDGTVVTSMESNSISLPTTQTWPASTKMTYVATVGSDNSITFAPPTVQPWVEEYIGGGVIIQ